MMRHWNWLVGLMLAWPVFADIVELKDGSRVEGAIRRVAGGWEVTGASGKKTIVTDDTVKGIEKGAPDNPAEAAAARLAIVRKLTETMTDPAQVIERYEKFIAQYKDTPAVEDARKDLDIWKKRQAGKLVKIGDRWLSPEEQREMLGKVVPMIEEARELAKDNKVRDAEAAVARLLAIDPKNAAGLYLQGLVCFKSDRVADAKMSWETLRDIVPDHAPTLNNLAVIMAKQKQALGALALYDMAMVASPQNRMVLDNTAEALHAVSDREKTALTFKRASKRFEEQDLEMQKIMKEKGLSRWGSTWVDADKMAEIKAAEEKIKAKLEALKTEYDRVVDRIKEIDNQFDINNRTLGQINNDRTFTDGNGRMTQLPPPAIYYKIMAENDKMWSEQKALKEKLETFRGRAAEIERERPVPAYTGVYRVIEAEGTPLLAAPGAPPAPRLPVPPAPAVEKPAI
ncbi:MAG: hypothetical protein ABSH20_15655 [Tepidisphaeraceae bacterium]